MISATGHQAIRWKRKTEPGASPAFSKRHIRIDETNRTFCRLLIPEQAEAVEGEIDCVKCMDGVFFNPNRARRNGASAPTHEEIDRAMKNFIEDGGKVQKLEPGGASMLDEEDTT